MILEFVDALKHLDTAVKHKLAMHRSEKSPNCEQLGLSIWWSRGELNPRPQAIAGQIYMLSAVI